MTGALLTRAVGAASLIRQPLSRDLKEAAFWLSRWMIFQAEKKTHARILRWEYAWHSQIGVRDQPG